MKNTAKSDGAARRRRKTGGAWWWALGLAAAVCLAVYALNAALWEVRPGTVLGMSYGIAAATLLVALALYGVRRRAMSTASRFRFGGARGWLDFHLWGGALFLLLVLMHTGFRLPTGTLMGWLWALALWTALSGVAGRALQKWIPRVLAAGLSVEANFERIPDLVAEVRRRAESLVATCDRSIQSLYRRKIAPVLAAPERSAVYFLDVTGGARSRLRELDYLVDRLPPAEKEKLAELERLYRTKLELDAHYTLQQVLRVWLWIHLPPSLALLALAALHVFAVLYY
jgi:hypothetical protein